MAQPHTNLQTQRKTISRAEFRFLSSRSFETHYKVITNRFINGGDGYVCCIQTHEEV